MKSEIIFMDHPPDSSTIFKRDKLKTIDRKGGNPVEEYESKLSFVPLLQHWEKQLREGSAPAKLFAKEVLARAKRLPELYQPIDNPTWLSKYTELLELMLSPVFPAAINTWPVGKANAPFETKAFYHTPTWEPAFEVAPSSMDDYQTELQFDFSTLNICLAILSACYQQPLNCRMPAFQPVAVQGKDGVERFFRPIMNQNFLKINAIGNKPPLSKKSIQRLFENIYDTEAWRRALPPHKFEINGFTATTFDDVTAETALSRINSILLSKDALKTGENIAQLENLFRSYFLFPGLQVGVLSLRADDENFTVNDYPTGLLNWKKGTSLSEMPRSVYGRACHFGEVVISEQITAGNKNLLTKHGIGSHLVAPLKNSSGRVIGLVELGSTDAFAINSFTEIQLRNVLPQLSRSMERQQEELVNRIEALMRQKFTAMHPSVEWRFMEVAERYLSKLNEKGKAILEPILFKDIFPLYAQSDITSSSLTRNRTIREDIKTQMILIVDLLKLMMRRLDFPLLKHILQQAEGYVARLEDEMQTSDEAFFMHFILKEVHPLLREIAERGTLMHRAIHRYFGKLDPKLGIIYNKRKAYEESVNLINVTLSELMEEADDRAQLMIPHFFEKYQTDGVQFELYVGQSLLRHGKFSEFQLNNLRLWQLQTMCEVTRRMRDLKQILPMPLETAQLVFVYGQPISVRFRMDEKSFDVDGVYNLRYEIIKKRIDKAFVQGTEDRLTQPGKIAIVYAADPMRQLYLDFCAFLIKEGYIEEEIEELEIEKLQETQGLKALRVKVK